MKKTVLNYLKDHVRIAGTCILVIRTYFYDDFHYYEAISILNHRAQNMGKTAQVKKESVKFDRETAIERACYCPSYSPSKIRIQEYFVCDPPSPPLDICDDCPINGLREPSTIVIATYNKNDEVEDVEEDFEDVEDV